MVSVNAGTIQIFSTAMGWLLWHRRMETAYERLNRLLQYSFTSPVESAIAEFPNYSRRQVEQLYDLPLEVRLQAWMNRLGRPAEPSLYEIEMRRTGRQSVKPEEISPAQENAIRWLEDGRSVE